MNLLLLADEDFEGPCLAVVRDRRARHVLEVHRAELGKTLVVGRLGGLQGRGEVVGLSDEEVRLRVELDSPPPPACGVDLLMAMPRPKMLRRVLQGVASMGVKRLVLVNSARVEKSYFDTPFLAEAYVREQLVLGLEQGRDTVLPEVSVKRRFRPFVEDEAPALWPDPWRKVVLHPGPAAPGLGDAVEGAPQLVAAIGPEGGWVPFEVDLLAAHGFLPVSLGPRILRVDVAVPFVLGQLALSRQSAFRAQGIRAPRSLD